MTKSPGHEKWPDHRVHEELLGQRLQVEVNGQIVADSSDIIKLEEDGYPTRYYFARSDVTMAMLERSETTSKCPFKGTAHYYSLNVGDKRLEDAAWTYEDPYEEHQGLKDRVVFYDDKFQDIHVAPKN